MAANHTDVCMKLTEYEAEGTNDEEADILFNTSLVCGFLLVFIVGICGNTMVIYLSFSPTFSKAVNTMNTYIFHLGVADAMYVFASLFFTVTNFNRRGWVFGEVGCKVIPAIDIITMHVSVYVLGILSLERYLALVKPMVINRYRSWYYARVLCVLVWVSGISLTVPSATNMKLIRVGGEGESCEWSSGPDSHRRYIVSVFWITFAVPSLVMLLTYAMLFIHFTKVGPNQNASHVVSRSRRGVVSIVILIVGVYWICFTPFWVYQMMLVYDKCNLFDQHNTMGLITLILSYLNSCVNPFLYTLLPRKYNIWRKSKRIRGGRTVSFRLRNFD
ncbi:Urotensin-2 receptor [Holothuria leucospilota]|uniref:Urotensin-2 receptor n=1 Tax=Holothuria leucospilota TaxID=206669 RepID=A0A9Q1C2V6_HOLLE|nr:Urotensin-2 receptor [Holothuria leucospilota]